MYLDALNWSSGEWFITQNYKLKVIFGSSDTTLYGCDRKVLSLLFFN